MSKRIKVRPKRFSKRMTNEFIVLNELAGDPHSVEANDVEVERVVDPQGFTWGQGQRPPMVVRLERRAANRAARAARKINRRAR